MGEAEALVHLGIVGDVRVCSTEDTLVIWAMDGRDERNVVALLVVGHGSQRGRILDHQCVAVELVLTDAIRVLPCGRDDLVVTAEVVRVLPLVVRRAVAATGWFA